MCESGASKSPCAGIDMLPDEGFSRTLKGSR
jgi:hypothetical protein